MHLDRSIYEDLANAVIIQAAKDWREAAGILELRPLYPSAREEARLRAAQYRKGECEAFFRSGWMEVLTKVDGPWLLQRLKQEKDGERRRKEKQTA